MSRWSRVRFGCAAMPAPNADESIAAWAALLGVPSDSDNEAVLAWVEERPPVLVPDAQELIVV